MTRDEANFSSNVVRFVERVNQYIFREYLKDLHVRKKLKKKKEKLKKITDALQKSK